MKVRVLAQWTGLKVGEEYEADLLEMNCVRIGFVYLKDGEYELVQDEEESVGQRIVAGLRELNDALKNGTEDQFRRTKLVKNDDGTIKRIVSEPFAE